jgi:hypothetical protein
MEKKVVIIFSIMFVLCLISIISATHILRIIGQDSTPPVVNITYPLNTTYNVNVSVLNYSVYDSIGASKCWYSNNSGIWNSTIKLAGQNFTDVISKEGSNTWTVYCNDTSGNVNFSSITFIKDTSVPLNDNGNTAGSSGGGSTGSASQFWKVTYSAIDSDLNNLNGYIKILGTRERIKFNILNKEHHIGVLSISSSSESTIIQIMSNPMNVTFKVGEEKKFDLNNDNIYDTSVKLNSIVNKSANITIILINEPVNSMIKENNYSGNVLNKTENTTIKKTETNLKKSPQSPLIFIVIIIILVGLIITVLLVMRFIYKLKGKNLKVNYFHKKHKNVY